MSVGMWVLMGILIYFIGASTYWYFFVCHYCEGSTRPSWTLHEGNCIHCGALWIGNVYQEDRPKKKVPIEEKPHPLLDSELD